LLYRYTKTESGKPERKAKIYTQGEHGVDLGRLDRDAVRIIRRLSDRGFKAYLVGGAVRDLLLGKTPKDFDIATDARPKLIRGLFRRSRVIGRRFKLVHIYFGKNKIIEVSTFRSKSKDNNIFGTLGEDAHRRDFSCNALFYCPQKQQIIDYVDGFHDIKKRRVRILDDERRSFQEDPVRMLRAVKYAVMLDFRIPFLTRYHIRRFRREMGRCSPDRLTEEMYKILESGNSSGILKETYRLGLLEILAPYLQTILRENQRSEKASLLGRLSSLDEVHRSGKRVERGVIMALILVDMADSNPEWPKEPLALIQQSLRARIAPLIPSNKDLMQASRLIKLIMRKKLNKDDLLTAQRRFSMR
jgi:poly(A) polymerase